MSGEDQPNSNHLKEKQEEIPRFHESTMSRTRSWPDAGPTFSAWGESRRPWEAENDSGSTDNGREIYELWGGGALGSNVGSRRAVNPSVSWSRKQREYLLYQGSWGQTIMPVM